MSYQRAVVAAGAGTVCVVDVPFDGLAVPHLPGVERRGERLEHGVVLRILATCICGSDLHSVANPELPLGIVCGHEATGVVEKIGRDVRRVRVGDVCSIPFNVSCGRCSYCDRGMTAHCSSVASNRLGATYGLGPNLGGWAGLQAELALVPYADFNVHVFSDRERAMDKLLGISALADVLPTGYHAAVQARVDVGCSVYIAGAGPVGLATAGACRLRGANLVILGDPNAERRKHAENLGFETLDPSAVDVSDGIEDICGERFVDASVDCVGANAGAAVVNAIIGCTRAGGAVSIAGVHPAAGETGLPLVPLWLGGIWAKALTVTAGATPAKKYQPTLSNAILNEQLDCVALLGIRAVAFEDAPEAYRRFQAGESAKFVLIP